MTQFTKEEELLFQERDALSRANQLTDIILDQAFTNNENMDNQNHVMINVGERNSTFASILDDSKKVMKSINWHQHKNTIVLACVCAFCIFFLIWYTFL